MKGAVPVWDLQREGLCLWGGAGYCPAGCEEPGMDPESGGLEQEREKKVNAVKFGRGEVKYSPSQEIWERNQIDVKIRRYVGGERKETWNQEV